MTKILLKGAKLVTPEGVAQKDLILDDGKIRIGITEAEQTVDVSGKYIVPGFVDIHNHGYGLFDFTLGLYDPKTNTFDNDPEIYQQSFQRLSKQYAQFGVTAFYLATFAESLGNLNNCYQQLAEYLKNSKSTDGAKLLGGFLEGTFINPAMAGAQNKANVFEPSIEVFEQIKDQDSIKLALVGPCAGKKSCDLIRYLTDKGVVAGFGHTLATCQQVVDAVEAGLRYCVHFTNGPTGNSFKPFDGGGAVEAVLKFDQLSAELICDGYHVNPAYILDIIKRKGFDNILGVTDCMFAGGADIKEFTIGGIRGVVSKTGEYIRVAEKENTLFGSILTMDRAFKNLLNWLTQDMEGIWNPVHPAMGLDAAAAAAAKIYSTNPCALLGLDKKGYGKISDGSMADLCVLDISGAPGNYDVKVEKTIVEGKIVFSDS